MMMCNPISRPGSRLPSCSSRCHVTFSELLQMAYAKNLRFAASFESKHRWPGLCDLGDRVQRVTLRILILQKHLWERLQWLFGNGSGGVLVTLMQASVLSRQERRAVCLCHNEQRQACPPRLQHAVWFTTSSLYKADNPRTQPTKIPHPAIDSSSLRYLPSVKIKLKQSSSHPLSGGITIRMRTHRKDSLCVLPALQELD
eukprot:TRINITY_DN14460_c0_g1_i1.p1 TRINITY_DN14460_c0_g1~~TRINITY_DN14460_c0_g1_i1.p1  ORF type:complete len:200 (+),score=7.83 TRINITY_DN14460_c0_g1_i1:64-663(+)